MGGKEKTTLKEISEILGKETIDSFNTSETRGRELSHGLNYQKLGKELMTQDEIAVMDGGKCILQLRGVRPFFSDKFDMLKTVEQMSKISGIGENKLRELMDSGELEYIQNGNRRLIADAAIWDWYHRAKTTAKPPARQGG